MKNTVRFAAVALVLSLSSGAWAAPALPSRHELRQLVQQEAIDDAVRAGRMTAERARALHDEQAGIAAREAAYRRDGVFTAREASVLEYLLDVASRHIDQGLSAPTTVAQGR